MKNTYNSKFIYFLSLEKIEDQHEQVPDALEEFDGVAVVPYESLNIGIVDDILVSLDWCEAVPTRVFDEAELKEIIESFEDKEVYTPVEEVLYDAFIKASEVASEVKVDAINITRALGCALSIIEKNKEVLPLSDLVKIKQMRKDLAEVLI